MATLQDKKITCGKTFVDRVRDVCIWEKTRSKSADVPKRGGRGAELPPDVSRQFLRKSHIYLSKLVTVGTSTKKQTINTSCLVGLLPKSKTAIKQFLNFQDDDLKELAESGSVRAFSALNTQFPENLETFKDFIGLFGEGENSISRKHVSRFTSMHAGKGTEGLAPPGILGLVEGQWRSAESQGIPDTDPGQGIGKLFQSVWGGSDTPVPFHQFGLAPSVGC